MAKPIVCVCVCVCLCVCICVQETDYGVLDSMSMGRGWLIHGIRCELARDYKSNSLFQSTLDLRDLAGVTADSRVGQRGRKQLGEVLCPHTL